VTLRRRELHRRNDQHGVRFARGHCSDRPGNLVPVGDGDDLQFLRASLIHNRRRIVGTVCALRRDRER
jgi:hypothetical protein